MTALQPITVVKIGVIRWWVLGGEVGLYCGIGVVAQGRPDDLFDLAVMEIDAWAKTHGGQRSQ
jgi:hypothetical protein